MMPKLDLPLHLATIKEIVLDPISADDAVRGAEDMIMLTILFEIDVTAMIGGVFVRATKGMGRNDVLNLYESGRARLKQIHDIPVPLPYTLADD